MQHISSVDSLQNELIKRQYLNSKLIATDDGTLNKLIHFLLEDQINEQDEDESQDENKNKRGSLTPGDVVSIE